MERMVEEGVSWRGVRTAVENEVGSIDCLARAEGGEGLSGDGEQKRRRW